MRNYSRCEKKYQLQQLKLQSKADCPKIFGGRTWDVTKTGNGERGAGNGERKSGKELSAETSIKIQNGR